MSTFNLSLSNCGSAEEFQALIEGLQAPLPDLPASKVPFSQKVTLVVLGAAFKALDFTMTFIGDDGTPRARPKFARDPAGHVLVGNHYNYMDAIAWDVYVTQLGRHGNMVVKSTLDNDPIAKPLMKGGKVIRLPRERGMSFTAIVNATQQVMAATDVWISLDGTTNLAILYGEGAPPLTGKEKLGPSQIAYVSGRPMIPVAAVGQQRFPALTDIKGIPKRSHLRHNRVFLAEGEPLHPSPAERAELGMELDEYLAMYAARAREAIRQLELTLYPHFLDTLDAGVRRVLHIGMSADPARADDAFAAARDAATALAPFTDRLRPVRDQIRVIDDQIELIRAEYEADETMSGTDIVAVLRLQEERDSLSEVIAVDADDVRRLADDVRTAERAIHDALRNVDGVWLPPYVPAAFGGGAPTQAQAADLHQIKRARQFADFVLDDQTAAS